MYDNIYRFFEIDANKTKRMSSGCRLYGLAFAV